MLRTEFIDEKKQGETLSFKFPNNERMLHKKIRNQQKTIKFGMLVIACLFIWNLITSIGFAIGLTTIHNDLRYPQEVQVVDEPSAEVNTPVIKEDLSSFTLTPVDVPPLKK